MTSIGTGVPRESGKRQGFSPLRDLPAVLWLLAVVVVALVHREVTAPRWLLFHLLLRLNTACAATACGPVELSWWKCEG
jgi:nitrite reductase (NO-forming)